MKRQRDEETERRSAVLAAMLCLHCLLPAAYCLPPAGEHRLAAGSVTPVTREVAVDGSLTVTGSRTRPTIQNLQANHFAPVFRLGDGDRLTLLEIIVTGKYTGDGKSNRAVHMDGRGAGVTLRNVTVVDGAGVEAHRGHIDWEWGGNLNTYGYGLYAGNNMAGDEWIATGRVAHCQFDVGRSETAVRLMGFHGVLEACRFSADSDAGRAHKKESLQARHGQFAITGCFSDSWVIGSLDPSIDGGKHVDYAQRNATYAYVAGHTQAGYLTVSGRSFVAIERLHVAATDPRGIGDRAGAAIWTKTYQTRHGVHRPRVYIRDSSVDAFGSFASSDIIIGPGCTYRGQPLVVSPLWDAAEFDRIKAVAMQHAPTPPTPPPATQPTQPPQPVPPATQPVMSVTVPAGTREIRMVIE